MESEELNKLVLDKMTKVCLCKGISRATIKKQSPMVLTRLQRYKRPLVRDRDLVMENAVRRRLKSCCSNMKTVRDAYRAVVRFNEV